MPPAQVSLFEVSSNNWVDALLYDAILANHLDDYEQKWVPITRTTAEEHTHWDWTSKDFSPPGKQSFAIECCNETQGMMIVDPQKRCQLPEHDGQELVYVDYLEAAPWNRSVIQDPPRYRLVGTLLITAAITLSRELGYNGKIGLHSLPQAERYYRNRCGMTDLGEDEQDLNLRDFEMTEDQADRFLSDER